MLIVDEDIVRDDTITVESLPKIIDELMKVYLMN